MTAATEVSNPISHGLQVHLKGLKLRVKLQSHHRKGSVQVWQSERKGLCTHCRAANTALAMQRCHETSRSAWTVMADIACLRSFYP